MRRRSTWWFGATMLGLLPIDAFSAGEPKELIGAGQGVAAFRSPTGNWAEVGAVALKEDDPGHLSPEPGQGVLTNDPPGKTWNLVTNDSFGDVEVHVEFLMARGSNSGIKLIGLYEIQMHDSFGVEKPSGSDNGGIYPRAQLLPRYRHIDEGIAPRLNASKPPGEWQELDLVFRAPRFDADGNKTENARFERVTLNGRLIHEAVDVPYPTGHAWDMKPEIERGPILLQGDHGPVAFRSLRVRPLEADSAIAP